jgi:hypothetical protein
MDVFPAPRKPVKTVIGMVDGDGEGASDSDSEHISTIAARDNRHAAGDFVRRQRFPH